jgi:hypothetical protein
VGFLESHILETEKINVPCIVCSLSVHIDLADENEPIPRPRALLAVHGTIDDFSWSYPLSKGAELIINKLPLGTVERLIIRDNRGTLSIFAETSGKVFIPNAKQDLDDIAAGYEALKLKVTPLGRTKIR